MWLKFISHSSGGCSKIKEPVYLVSGGLLLPSGEREGKRGRERGKEREKEREREGGLAGRKGERKREMERTFWSLLCIWVTS
jgi:hypothetical protein